MTERLYYTDSYLTQFQAVIVDRAENRIYLDQTAFYPTSGGQPFDRGSIGDAAVVDVIDEGDRIAHVVDHSPAADVVQCRVDWPRRFDHMQQHSGQHLLSAVFAEIGRFETVSVHLGETSSTLDLRCAALAADVPVAAEDRANELIAENRSVTVSFADASSAEGLRKESARTGTLRIVEIDGLDRSACGGTHVRSTGEIGAISIQRIEKIRDTARVEFLCGGRAVRKARVQRAALDRIARVFSASPDATPDLVAGLAAKVKDLEKENRRLAAVEAAVLAARAYEQTPPDADGLRRRTVRGPIDREAAQAWCKLPRTIYAGLCEEPPSLLLAASEDSGIDAAARLRDLIAPEGGRGGGSPRMAQASLPSTDALARVAARLL